MNNSDNEYDFKSIFVNYILLITLCIFVVIYIIINYNMIKIGNYYGGDITKSVLLTGIIILLLYLLATWDDNDILDSNMQNNQEGGQEIKMNQDANSIEIPKFSLADVNKLANPTLSNYQSGQIGQTILQQLPQNQAQIYTQILSQPQPQLQTQLPTQLPIITNISQGIQVPNTQNNFGIQNGLGTMEGGESRYRINNNIFAPIPTNSFGNSSIQVKYNNPVTNLTQVKRHIDKLENQNIFVSQKNSLRYGIKF